MDEFTQRVFKRDRPILVPSEIPAPHSYRRRTESLEALIRRAVPYLKEHAFATAMLYAVRRPGRALPARFLRRQAYAPDTTATVAGWSMGTSIRRGLSHSMEELTRYCLLVTGEIAYREGGMYDDVSHDKNPPNHGTFIILDPYADNERVHTIHAALAQRMPDPPRDYRVRQ